MTTDKKTPGQEAPEADNRQPVEAAETEESGVLGEHTADGATDDATDDATDQAADVPEDSEQLVTALLEARHQAESHWETVLRTQAEMDNLRKRVARDVENAHKFGLEKFLEELLPVRDSMELGLAAAGEDEADTAQVREGVELTLKMLTSALEKFGVEIVDPVDSAFDPDFHQAMSMQEVPGVESGTVTMVMQKGFVLNGRLVRPALVMVAK